MSIALIFQGTLLWGQCSGDDVLVHSVDHEVGGFFQSRRCETRSFQICAPPGCDIDYSRMQSDPQPGAGGNWGQAEAGFGVDIHALTALSGSSVTYDLDPVTECLTVTYTLCSSFWRRATYVADHFLYLKCNVECCCACPEGAWWDDNRNSCVTGACDVPGMPDGDKGGGYFAWEGTLYQDVPCDGGPDLNLNLNTGTAPWTVVQDPVPNTTEPRLAVIMTGVPVSYANFPNADWMISQTDERTAGLYIYELEFCLCACFAESKLNLEFLSDDQSSVWLNGQPIGNSTVPGFQNSASISISAASLLQAGTNRLQVRVTNAGLQTGFNLQGTLFVEGGGSCNGRAAAVSGRDQKD